MIDVDQCLEFNASDTIPNLQELLLSNVATEGEDVPIPVRIKQ
jgi:hypothetical protein